MHYLYSISKVHLKNQVQIIKIIYSFPIIRQNFNHAHKLPNKISCRYKITIEKVRNDSTSEF